MTSADQANSFASLFTAHFGQLVVLLRRQPGNTPAQKSALRSAMAVLPRGRVTIEAGIEYSEVPDDGSLKGRLLLRRVDAIHFATTASAADVLSLARALATDSRKIPSVPAIEVELLSASGVRGDLEPAGILPDLEPEPPPTQRHRTMSGPVQESDALAHALERAASSGHWMEALHAAQAMVNLTARFPEHERRGHLIALRRIFTRQLLDEFIHFAMRFLEEQGRVSEVLRHAGPEAIELMVDHVRGSESIGPRGFLHDVLASEPTALPMLLPLLNSSRWHEVRHGAVLLGRLGLPQAIVPLRVALDHPDERVRKAVVESLARFNQNTVVEPIRRALTDPAPATRASAAHALARRNSPGLALPILVALEMEKDPEAWNALVGALARMESNEATTALVAMALDRRPFLKAGRPLAQRLSIVSALAGSETTLARRALERLASEGEGRVGRAATAAIGRKKQ